MKPVDQTVVADKKGDCLRACVCSLLELPIDAAPNFAELDFFVGLDAWLAERGLRFIRFSIPDDGYRNEKYGCDLSHESVWFGYAGQEGNPDYMLAWGQSPRNNAEGMPRQHIIVAQADGYGVKVAHDPHESRAGLVKIWGFGWIVKR
jgi:hypothetical protein